MVDRLDSITNLISENMNSIQTLQFITKLAAMIKGIIFLCGLLTVISPRHFETSLKFTLFARNKGWVYVDKMTFAPGTAQVQLQTSTQGLPYGRNSQIFIQAIPEERWQEQLNLVCEAHITRPLAVHQLTLDGQARSSTFTFQVEDYKIYYFVLKDCQKRFLSQYNNTNLSLHVKLHLMNNDKEVGEEEDHWYIVPFIIVAGLIVIHFYMKNVRNQGPQYMDYPKIMLFMGTATQISSLFWKSFGFLIYTFTGADYAFFHYIYLLMHSTSESAIIALISLMGFGWTLTFYKGKNFDLFLPLIGCLGFINIVITIVTKIGHEHDRHHVFDSLGGSILIGFRIIITLVFVFACFKTFKKVRINLKKFMTKFGILGFIYIASMPLVVLLANWKIPPKNRHQFVFICIELIKFTTNMILGYEMNAQSSAYNKVNYKNASFIPDEEQGFR